MNTALVFSLIGSAGFLAGVAALLSFFNTRKSTRTKGGAEAYQAYQEFVHGATDDRDREITRLRKNLETRDTQVWKLVDIVQDLIKYMRARGATASETDPFQDRLDVERARN